MSIPYNSPPYNGFRTEWDIEMQKMFAPIEEPEYLPGTIAPTAPWEWMTSILGPNSNFWPRREDEPIPSPMPTPTASPMPYRPTPAASPMPYRPTPAASPMPYRAAPTASPMSYRAAPTASPMSYRAAPNSSQMSYRRF